MREPRRARPGRPPKMARPDQVEREYRRILTGITDALSEAVTAGLIPIISSAVAEQDRLTRGDAWVEDVVSAVTRIRLSMSSLTQSVERETVMIGQNVADFNSVAWRRVVRSAVGVDFQRTEPWLRDVINSFAAENAALIRDIPEKALTDIQGLVQRGVRTGLTARELEADIKRKLKTTDARARLIARDQVSKLNGQITRQRQMDLGLRTYIWNTSGDERVRESHRVMNGKLCKWDDETVYSDDNGKTWKKRSSIGGEIAHPGQPVNCRCGGESRTDELLDELGL